MQQNRIEPGYFTQQPFAHDIDGLIIVLFGGKSLQTTAELLALRIVDGPNGEDASLDEKYER